MAPKDLKKTHTNEKLSSTTDGKKKLLYRHKFSRAKIFAQLIFAILALSCEIKSRENRWNLLNGKNLPRETRIFFLEISNFGKEK